MKKISALTIIILMLLLLSGCGSQETPEINYTAEILINEEAPPKDLVWYADLQAPTPGIFILEIPSYRTYATVSTTGILPIARRDVCDILDTKAPFEDTFWQKIEFSFQSGRDHKIQEYELKVLGMTQEEYDAKIKKYFNLDDFSYYPDRVIGIIRPIIPQGETKETVSAEYSNKNILVDFDYETSVVIPYTDEELKNGAETSYYTSYEGRIGNRYYLNYGYYDLSDRKLYPYASESDLPPVKNELHVADRFVLYRVIEQDADAMAYIPDHHYVDHYSLIGDRYYAVLAQGNRYYDESIENYEGESVFFATVDAVTGKVLYLQKYSIKNYWGYQYRLLSLGEDGILYEPMLP